MSEDKAGVVSCPKCGKVAKCFHQEVGVPTHYWDEYTLFCESCGHRESKLEDGGEKDFSEEKTFCPYCGVSCDEHWLYREQMLRPRDPVERAKVMPTHQHCPNCKRGGLIDFSFCPYCGKPYRAPEPKKAETKPEKPKLEPKCKKCGGPAKCEYLGDLTKGPDYYDTYQHTCQDPKCGWSEQFDTFAGGAGSGTPFSVCPECGNCPEDYKALREVLRRREVL